MESARIIASVLDKLKLIYSNPEEAHEMKVELRLLRTFFLCARKWSSYVSLHSSLSNQHELKMTFLNFLSSLCSVEKAVNQIGQRLICLLSLRLEDRLSSRGLADRLFYFRKDIKRVYSLSDCFLQSSCSLVPVGDELVEFLDSLAENLVDLDDALQFKDKAIIEIMDILKEKMLFLKTFIRLGVFRRVEQRQLEHFLIHCEAVAVNAAHLFCILWFDRHDREVLKGVPIKMSVQLQKMKPVDPQVCEMYIQVLIALKLQESSHSLMTEAGKNMVGAFIDSLLGVLWKLLDFDNNFVVSVKLHEELMLLRNIIKQQPEKFNGLPEETKDLFGAVVTDAGIVVFSLYMQEMEKCWAREMDLALLNSLEKVQLIKSEIAEKYPAKSTFNFPAAANEVGFIDLLIENLKHLSSCEVDSNSFALDRFQKVQGDLVFLRSLLENIVGKSNRDEKLQAQRNRIIDVAYKVEFAIDALVVGDTSYSLLMLINNVIEEIQLVRTEALEIDDNEYVCEAQKDAQVSTQLPSKSTISTTNEVMVGLKDEAQEITDQLTRGSMQLDFVFIVGMPGIGKTTLAHKIYYDPSIFFHFHIHAWCTVSQVYSKKDLLLDILICIFPKNSNKYSEMREDDLAEELYRCLKGNRYVIVLDDVWGIEAWNYLRMSFPNDANGSRILLTSRIHKLALEIKPKSTLSLRQLTDDESWELLQKKLADREAYNPTLHELGMRIAKGCKGLPLTVVITAGILATLEQGGWEEVAEMIGSKVVSDTEQCRNMLELSFKHLPDYLKPCFLYFGAFPEDEEIPIERLISLWIAEGFVQKNEEKRREDMAEDYIKALIRRSLVMVAKQKSLGTVKTCRIHDLLHEFCLTKATEENFLQFVKSHSELLNVDEPNNLRRVCIYQSNHFVNPRHICPHVRSLLFLSQGSWRYLALENLLFICNLKLLRVLVFGKVSLRNKFPDEITVLFQLRYLEIANDISSIPPSIARLSNLETFRMIPILETFCWKGYVRKVLVPDTIWNMQMLRHLYVRGSWIDLTLAEDKLECFSHLCNLQTFVAPRFHLGERMEKIMRKFPNISTQSAKGASDNVVVMDFLSQLESLKLIVNGWDVLHIDFLFPLNLKKLSLNIFLQSTIATIGKLPNLEALKVIPLWKLARNMGNGRRGIP